MPDDSGNDIPSIKELPYAKPSRQGRGKPSGRSVAIVAGLVWLRRGVITEFYGLTCLGVGILIVLLVFLIESYDVIPKVPIWPAYVVGGLGCVGILMTLVGRLESVCGAKGWKSKGLVLASLILTLILLLLMAEAAYDAAFAIAFPRHLAIRRIFFYLTFWASICPFVAVLIHVVHLLGDRRLVIRGTILMVLPRHRQLRLLSEGQLLVTKECAQSQLNCR